MSDRYTNPDKFYEPPSWGGQDLNAPLPETTMQSLPSITPRPFDIEVEPREFASASPDANPTLYLIAGSELNKVQVTPGYVNAVMPEIGTTPLDDDPIPEITISGATDIWLRVEGTFDTPTDSYAVTVVTTAPTNAITATGFVSGRQLGSVALVSGAAVITHLHQGGDLGVESFGAVNLWWKQ